MIPPEGGAITGGITRVTRDNVLFRASGCFSCREASRPHFILDVGRFQHHPNQAGGPAVIVDVVADRAAALGLGSSTTFFRSCPAVVAAPRIHVRAKSHRRVLAGLGATGEIVTESAAKPT